VQNFPYTVHVRFNTADGQSEVAGLSRDDCSVGRVGMSDDDASESEYAEGEVD